MGDSDSDGALGVCLRMGQVDGENKVIFRDSVWTGNGELACHLLMPS